MLFLQEPTRLPTQQPSVSPVEAEVPVGFPPIPSPTDQPTPNPTTAEPTTFSPTIDPTLQPTTFSPTTAPPITNEPSTVQPTPAPVVQPITAQPTDEPTLEPTFEPTGQPMEAQIFPTNNPTLAPTRTMVCNPPITLAQRQEEILAILNGVTPESVILTPGTSENDAFVWLLDEDSAQVCPEDELDVIQRYVMAVNYFSLGGDNWDMCNALSSPSPAPCIADQQRYLSEANVCRWFNVTCDSDDENIVAIALGTFDKYC